MQLIPLYVLFKLDGFYDLGLELEVRLICQNYCSTIFTVQWVSETENLKREAGIFIKHKTNSAR